MSQSEIDRFDDVLHAHGDDIDEINDLDIDFDAFFGDFDKNEEEPEPTTDLPWMNPTVTTESVSQKRPVLTPVTPTTAAPIKKIKSYESQESMPKYLSDENKFFEENILPLIPQHTMISRNLLIEELRQLAFLEHQLQIVNFDIALWTVYLQSGTGKLNVGIGNGEGEVDERSILQQLQYPLPTPPCVWPEKLKTIIIDDPDVLPNDKVNLRHATYLNYVNQMLTQYQNECSSYQSQIEQKRQLLQTDLTEQIEQKIINLVDNYGTALYAIINEGSIAAVRFTFKERILELEFEREDLMKFCIQSFRTLTQSKTTSERANMEVKILETRFANQQILPIIGSFQISIPQDLQTIQDESIRQRLTNRYDQLLQRTKSELALIHIRTAQIKANELTKEFDNQYRQFFQKLRESYSEQSLKNTLTNIMDRRCNLVEQRLQTLTDLKIRFFVKAPTVNKF